MIPKPDASLAISLHNTSKAKKWDDKIIEDYKFEIDQVGDKVYINLSIDPKYPAVNFKINMEAEKEGDRMNFKAK